jgi:hypothetical protein
LVDSFEHLRIVVFLDGNKIYHYSFSLRAIKALEHRSVLFEHKHGLTVGVYGNTCGCGCVRSPV